MPVKKTRVMAVVVMMILWTMPDHATKTQAKKYSDAPATIKLGKLTIETKRTNCFYNGD